jgi:meromycolic acid enoyl-[acyl-carrier protein] reductase
MGILDGKRILVTGVLTDSSIAFHVARIAQLEGATVVLTGFGRLSLVERIAKRLPQPPPVLELDVTDSGQLESLAERVSAHVDGLDGLVHAIAFAPPGALGGNFLNTPWEDVATAVQVSAYSLKSLAVAALPLMTGTGAGGSGPSGSGVAPGGSVLAGGSGPSGSGVAPGGSASPRAGRAPWASTAAIVGLDFDASRAWPAYDWMGVAKAGLESCARYLARDLGAKGVRVNLVAAGPVRTMAAKSIPGFERFEQVWGERAPLGWQISDPEPPARACVALLSDWFPATTGEIVHVDGGVHAMGW